VLGGVMMRTEPWGSVLVGIFFGAGTGSPLGATVPAEVPQQLSQQLFRWNRPPRRSLRLCLQQLSQALHFGAGQQAGLQQELRAGLQQVVGQAGWAQQLLRWNRPPRPPHAGGQAGAQVSQQLWRQRWWQRGAGAQHDGAGHGLPQHLLRWHISCKRSHRLLRPQQVF
jgi:hypothetical protein